MCRCVDKARRGCRRNKIGEGVGSGITRTDINVSLSSFFENIATTSSLRPPLARPISGPSADPTSTITNPSSLDPGPVLAISADLGSLNTVSYSGSAS